MNNRNVEVTNIGRSAIRLTSEGFCWEFTGRTLEGGKPVTVTLYFDFAWVSALAGDLRNMLDLRDSQTAKARAALRED